MHVVQGYHHALWFRQHWKLDGIVGGGAVFAITYSILNAVQNRTLNSTHLGSPRHRKSLLLPAELPSPTIRIFNL